MFLINYLLFFNVFVDFLFLILFINFLLFCNVLLLIVCYF